MKFFKNMIAYNITGDVPLLTQRGILGAGALEAERELNKALSSRMGREPGSQELSTYGFVDPYPRRPMTLADRETPELEDDLEPTPPTLHRTIRNGHYILLCASILTRNISGKAITRKLSLKIDEIEESQLRKVYKKERDQLKDEIIQAALPTALVSQKTTYALIDTQRGRIYIEASSHRAAEDLLCTLRDCLGSLPVLAVRTKCRPEVSFTAWVKEAEQDQPVQNSTTLTLLDGALLKEVGAGNGKVALSHIQLDGTAPHEHINAGMEVSKVALAYKADLGFQVDGNLVFSKICFADLITEKAEEVGGEDYVGVLEASMLLMVEALGEVLCELLDLLGGEEQTVC